MLKVKKEGVILTSTNSEFEAQAVLNPGCIQVGNEVHMFYRAVRSGNHSTIGYCRLKGPLKVVERATEPILKPEYEYERHGVEDPRIVKYKDTYYMFYMAYNGKDVVVAYATSKDLKNWKKQGPISHHISYAEAKKIFMKAKAQERYFNYDLYDRDEKDPPEKVYIWGKDAFMFPKKIKGKFALLHRILPDIHVIYFKDFKDLTRAYWKKYLSTATEHEVLGQRYWFESRAMGAGAPPIETKYGWLLIYHGIENSPKGRIYRACAALLDKNDPCKLIGRLDMPLFSPEKPWEIKGDVNNVVFPTGTAIFGKRLYIYYGAADKKIAVASVNFKELIKEIIRDKGEKN